MKINRIKLSQLSKNAMGDNKMKHLKGAEYYCYFVDDPYNEAANGTQGKCSCYCSDSVSYYDTSTGLKAFGDFIRSNW